MGTTHPLPYELIFTTVIDGREVRLTQYEMKGQGLVVLHGHHRSWLGKKTPVSTEELDSQDVIDLRGGRMDLYEFLFTIGWTTRPLSPTVPQAG